MGEAASERLKQGGVLWPKRSLDIQRAEAGAWGYKNVFKLV